MSCWKEYDEYDGDGVKRWSQKRVVVDGEYNGDSEDSAVGYGE